MLFLQARASATAAVSRSLLSQPVYPTLPTSSDFIEGEIILNGEQNVFHRDSSHFEKWIRGRKRLPCGISLFFFKGLGLS